MQKLFFILTGIIFLNTGYAQKYYKASGYAFSILKQPGNIPVDENGVKINQAIYKERFIYIIIMGKVKPVINTILYNKTAVKWDLITPAEKEFSAVTESTQKMKTIKPSKGCSMWRINIHENDRLVSERAIPIIIKAKTANKLFTLFLYNETSLQGFDSY